MRAWWTGGASSLSRRDSPAGRLRPGGLEQQHGLLGPELGVERERGQLLRVRRDELGRPALPQSEVIRATS